VGERLQLVISTPGDVVVDEPVESLRVPTEIGPVVVRPGDEPYLLAVEPGLVVVGLAGGARFAATAGGLLDGECGRAELYPRFAVVGDCEADVVAAFARAEAASDDRPAGRRRFTAPRAGAPGTRWH